MITIDIENTKKALFKVYWDLINCMHNNDNDLNVDEQIIASLEKCWRADRNIEFNYQVA